MDSQPFYIIPFSSVNGTVGDDNQRGAYGALGIMVSTQSTPQPIRLDLSGQIGPALKENSDDRKSAGSCRAAVGIGTQKIGTKTFLSRPYFEMKFYKDLNLGLSRNSIDPDNWGAGIGAGFALVDQEGSKGPVIMRLGVTSSIDQNGAYAGLNLVLGGTTMMVEK